MQPSLNLITDIAGVRVGNAHDPRLASGVTAILIAQPNVAGCVVTGGGPGTRGASTLEPHMTVQGVDGIVLSGGSAFGLDAVGGVMGHLAEQHIGFQVRDAVVPIVAGAITFDLLNGGDKAWGRMPPYWDLGYRAAADARDGVFALGTVGGGYGATTANLKGGLGSASTRTASGFTVGAIAVVNAVGTVTVGDGPHFWAAPLEEGDEFGGLGMPPRVTAGARQLRVKGHAPPSTTIGLVVTDAVLSKAEAKRLAIMADDGLARAVRPAHAPMDGDTVFAVATQKRALQQGAIDLTEIGMAAGDCLARAIARAVFEATALPLPGALPAWRDRHGSGVGRGRP